jgi:hypothetical protein
LTEAFTEINSIHAQDHLDQQNGAVVFANSDQDVKRQADQLIAAGSLESQICRIPPSRAKGVVKV